ncbi:growth arrest-specific protein 1-like [Centruroides sculpturatus]|uniref:growth arrest-specific protein 1-like n=1 Tax=Centruroides sculpturatus TaxID=218467 RepID=UPI000C6D2058|nr:growth arrest-specific protein 1-like [Centruroides sculpturatus]
MLLYLLLCLHSSGVTARVNNTCDVLLKECTDTLHCGMVLHSYRISCQKERYGLVGNCSEICRRSIIDLTTTHEGYDYLHCHCGDDEYCQTIRKRMSSCWDPRAVRVKDPGPPVDCRVAENTCQADPICLEAYRYYRSLCVEMFQGIECSRRCNNTISILNRQKLASKWEDCACNDRKCKQERSNMLRLCLGVNGNVLSCYESFKGTFLIFEGIVIFLRYFWF